MKYIKTYEAAATEYKQKFRIVDAEIREGIKEDFLKIFKKLKTDCLIPCNKKDYHKKYPMIEEEYYLQKVYLYKDEIYFEYLSEESEEHSDDIYDFDLQSLIIAYEYFEDLTLEQLFLNLHEDENNYNLGKLYANNYYRLDLDELNFFNLYEKDRYAFNQGDENDMINDYHFQKWLLTNHSDKFKFMDEEGIIWDEKIKEEFEHIFSQNQFGMFDK